MALERTRILEMLAEGKVSVEEAQRLLDALAADGEPGALQLPVAAAPPSGAPGGRPKFLRVTVNGTAGDSVNVRVPLGLLRAGMKLTALIPLEAVQRINARMSEEGIPFDLTALKQEDIEALIESLGEIEVSVDSSNGGKVRVFCE